LLNFSPLTFEKHFKVTLDNKLVALTHSKNSYAQTVPSRFRKEVISAADEDKDGQLTAVEIEHLLKNIGASDKLSKDELDHIMNELGVKSKICVIPVDRMADLLESKKFL